MKISPILGLLGGIGSGKSTVAAILARLGAFVLDADQYAKELLYDPEVCQEVKEAFGTGVFRSDGEIDKARLADQVFASEANRTQMNAIIHPRVRLRFREQVEAIRAQSPEKIIVFDIPLLLGSELRPLCDLLIMVRASLSNRLERVEKHRGWDKDEVARREAYQPSIAQKEAAADVIIENDGTEEELERKVKEFFKNLSSKRSTA